MLGTLVLTAGSARGDADLDFFEKKIRPVLVEHCYKCHSAQSKRLRGKLRLDTVAGMQAGGETGVLFVAGKPKASLLMTVLRHEDMAMPPNGKLSNAIIADFESWITRGATLPKVASSAPTPRREAFRITDADRAHWAFQPIPEIKKPMIPAPTEIDRFVRARLDAKGLQPAGAADKHTLLRRATHDLTGLPPTPAEIDAFLADKSPDAFARVVDRLLASPEFGVYWGRHWLDGVRYASDVDKTGKYRDWVIRSYNVDLPYDQFVRMQLAGDLLPAGEGPIHASGASLDGVVATGMLSLAVWERVARDLAVAEIVDSQIDVVGRQFLGLTLACARCHDHKFDPISNADYYGLAGIFFSTRISPGKLIADGRLSSDVLTLPLLTKADAEKNRRLNAEIARLVKERGKLIADLPGAGEVKKLAEKIESLEAKVKKAKGAEKTKLAKELKGLRDQLGKLDAVAKQAKPDECRRIDDLAGRIGKLEKEKITAVQVMAAQEGGVPGSNREKIGDAPILIRGDHRREGPVIPRRFPVIVAGEKQAAITSGSGRLELARWITRPDNPLTSRVMANRVWQHLFGEGLVRTPSNFGKLGETPSHPELLDYLAARFVADGWSVKSLIRGVMLTDAYQRSSFASPELVKGDPDNRLLGRMNRKRLTYESIRDSLLLVSSRLALTGTSSKGKSRRSIFEPLERGRSNSMMAMFDGPDPSAIVPERADTTTAPQALFMMNNKLVLESARRIASVIEGDARLKTDEARVDHVYRRLLGRPALEQEKRIAAAYVKNGGGWTNFLQVLLCTNEFVYVD